MTPHKAPTLPKSCSFDEYPHYAKLSYWTKTEAIMLKHEIRPKEDLSIARTMEYIMNTGNDIPDMEVLNRSIECKEIASWVNERKEVCIKPLDFINWCRDKDIFLAEELKLLVKNHHANFNNKVDFKIENNQQREKITLLEEENTKLKKELEQKFLHKTTEISYQKLLAMICAAFKLSKEQFNAYQIYTLASNCKLKFPLLSQSRIAKYLKTPRSLLDLPETQAKSKNTAIK